MRIRIIFGVIFLILSFLLLIFFIFGPNGIIDSYKKQEQISNLKEKIKTLEKQNQAKKEIIEILKNNQSKEIYAKGIGLNLSEGEYVFKFNTEDYPKIYIQKDTEDTKHSKLIYMFFTFVVLLTLAEIVAILSLLRSIRRD